MRKALSIYPVELPSLPKLLHLEIPEKVGTNYYEFGVFLLDDETGDQVDIIESDCNGKAEKITRKILQEWLKGKGLPVTWPILIKTLRDLKLSTLADQIEATYSRQPHPPQCSDGEPPRKKHKK